MLSIHSTQGREMGWSDTNPALYTHTSPSLTPPYTIIQHYYLQITPPPPNTHFVQELIPQSPLNSGFKKILNGHWGKHQFSSPFPYMEDPRIAAATWIMMSTLHWPPSADSSSHTVGITSGNRMPIVPNA